MSRRVKVPVRRELVSGENELKVVAGHGVAPRATVKYQARMS